MHNYDYGFNINGSSAAASVVNMVGENKHVLEIGAGPGSITKVFLQRGCTADAIELDQESVKILSTFCKNVHSLDLNDPLWTQALKGQKYDAIVAADVLEHLYNPWQTLKDMKPIMNEKGRIILSLPHAGHSTVIASLLNEDFRYEDNGLLDRTHIRFFGLKNIEDLVKEAGFKIIEAKFVTKKPEKSNLKDQWMRLGLLAKLFLTSHTDSSIYQVVVKIASKDDPEAEVSFDKVKPRTNFLKLIPRLMKIIFRHILRSNS